MFKTYFKASDKANKYVEDVQTVVTTLKDGGSITKLEVASYIIETFVELNLDINELISIMHNNEYIYTEDGTGKQLQIVIRDEVNNYINNIPTATHIKKPMKFNIILEWMALTENRMKYYNKILYRALDLELVEKNYYRNSVNSKYKYLF